MLCCITEGNYSVWNADRNRPYYAWVTAVTRTALPTVTAASCAEQPAGARAVAYAHHVTDAQDRLAATAARAVRRNPMATSWRSLS